jgi:hypothetical protein
MPRTILEWLSVGRDACDMTANKEIPRTRRGTWGFCAGRGGFARDVGVLRET